MGESAAYKWLVRAERYEEILRAKGQKEAKKYLLQFDKNMDKFLSALWELRGIKEDQEAEYQAEVQNMKTTKKVVEEDGII